MMNVRSGEPTLRRRSACVSQETDMEEHGIEFVGTLFVLPESRSFELKTMLHGSPATLTGTVCQQLAAQFAGNPAAGTHIDVRQLALQPRRVEILTREIHERHRAPRKVHFLMRVIDGGVQQTRHDDPITA
jgi:hypothetical protein